MLFTEQFFCRKIEPSFLKLYKRNVVDTLYYMVLSLTSNFCIFGTRRICMPFQIFFHTDQHWLLITIMH